MRTVGQRTCSTGTSYPGGGRQGIDQVLLILAEEVLAHAPDHSRNKFARVVPETALDRDAYDQLRQRVSTLNAHAALGGVSDMDVLCHWAAAYLNAVQRDDPSQQCRVLSEVNESKPADRRAVHEIILGLASRFAPLSE